MRGKTLTPLIIFLTLLFSSIKVYGNQAGDCYPTSTFCCEGQYSIYCTLTTSGFGTTNILKKEKRTITWTLGAFTSEDVIYPSGDGKCAVKTGPCGERSVIPCFPIFNSPFETYNYWEQQVIHQIADLDTCYIICGRSLTSYTCPSCEAPSSFGSTTYSVDGPCQGGGGGGSGGGCGICNECAGQSACGACGGWWVGWPDCCCYSDTPIVIDIQGDGFHLTNAANGVSFDINPGGDIEHVAWTAPNTDDAWLVLDRNGNGVIDNGRELFGNRTPQPPSDVPNGFLALGEYDKAVNGGNTDGVINNQDAIFSLLRVWNDMNHNGISEIAELHTLQSIGLAKIELNYRESRRRDEHGNWFRYRAKVYDNRDAHLGRWAWDVFLAPPR